jgi:hypothetical protein
MLIFSLPYLFDLICGLYAMSMMSHMARFNKIMIERKRNEDAARRLLSNEVYLYFYLKDIERIREKYDHEAVDRIYSDRISKNLL